MLPFRNLQWLQRVCLRTLSAGRILTKLIISWFELSLQTWNEWQKNTRKHQGLWSWWVSQLSNHFLSNDWRFSVERVQLFRDWLLLLLFCLFFVLAGNLALYFLSSWYEFPALRGYFACLVLLWLANAMTLNNACVLAENGDWRGFFDFVLHSRYRFKWFHSAHTILYINFLIEDVQPVSGR